MLAAAPPEEVWLDAAEVVLPEATDDNPAAFVVGIGAAPLTVTPTPPQNCWVNFRVSVLLR